MKISEVIKKLISIQEEQGDLDVIYYDSKWVFCKLEESNFNVYRIEIKNLKENNKYLQVHRQGDLPNDYDFPDILCIGEIFDL